MLLKQRVVGEHVRRLRTKAGLSLRALAGDTGFSPSFISQLENGQVSPSISSMEKIAEALGVTLGEFFAAAAGGEGGLVLRARDRQGLTSSWSRAEVEGLNTKHSSARLEPTLITLKVGGRSGKHPYGLPREEFAFVLEGTVALTLGPERHVLRKGDAVTILPGELRMWENTSRRPVRILTVSSGQRNHGPVRR
jgi:transcriptional regulator with XRE-family HTH domain